MCGCVFQLPRLRRNARTQASTCGRLMEHNFITEMLLHSVFDKYSFNQKQKHRARHCHMPADGRQASYMSVCWATICIGVLLAALIQTAVNNDFTLHYSNAVWSNSTTRCIDTCLLNPQYRVTFDDSLFRLLSAGDVGEARAIWDVWHYGKSLYLQNSESSNCSCVFHYSSVICRLRRASNIYIVTCVGGETLSDMALEYRSSDIVRSYG